jgi:rhodanese-related sulfurtransferase
VHVGPVVVHCEGGYRSAIAASLLQQLGRPDVHDLVGGYKGWLAAKLPAATG